MSGPMSPRRLLIVVALAVAAWTALRATLSFFTDGAPQAAATVPGGLGVVAGLLYAVYCSSRRRAFHGAAVGGVLAAAAVLAPLAFDSLPPPGAQPAEPEPYTAVVGLVWQFALTAAIVAWVRPTGGDVRSINAGTTATGGPPDGPVPGVYRSPRHGYLFGVCGGIARSMGADPARVRLAAVAGALFTDSAALLVYPLLAVVLAQEPGYDDRQLHPERSPT